MTTHIASNQSAVRAVPGDGAAEAQRDRFTPLLGRSGLAREQVTSVLVSPAIGPLCAALRRAEAQHPDLDQLVPRVINQHGLAAVRSRRTSSRASSPKHSDP